MKDSQKSTKDATASDVEAIVMPPADRQLEYMLETYRNVAKRMTKAKRKCRGVRLTFEEIHILDVFRDITTFADATDEDIQDIVKEGA
jgi:hypothetical protein